MQTRFQCLLAAAALALLPQLVFAQNERKPDDEAGALFQRLDANKDGQIAADEVGEDRKGFFERMVRVNDKNGDGKLSKEEFALGTRAGDRPNRPAEGERRPQQPGNPPPSRDQPPGGPEGRPNLANAPFFRAMDTNGDGKISADELATAAVALKKLDRNDDGFLTPEELIPPGPPGVAGRPQPGTPPGTPPGRPGQGAPGANVLAERLKQADTNGDGKLSKDEAPDRLKENFDRLDTNKDGFLDAAEMRQMADRFRPGAADQPQRRPEADAPPKKDEARKEEPKKDSTK